VDKKLENFRPPKIVREWKTGLKAHVIMEKDNFS